MEHYSLHLQPSKNRQRFHEIHPKNVTVMEKKTTPIDSFPEKKKKKHDNYLSDPNISFALGRKITELVRKIKEEKVYAMFFIVVFQYNTTANHKTMTIYQKVNI